MIALFVLLVSTASTPVSATPCAFDASWTFGFDGGYGAIEESFSLSAPATYKYSSTARTGAVIASCSVPVPACGAKADVTMSDLLAAMSAPDVVAALQERQPVLYGYDERPADGAVYLIRRASHGILVGALCGSYKRSTAGCRDAPAGVLKLKALLERLVVEEAGVAACKSAP